MHRVISLLALCCALSMVPDVARADSFTVDGDAGASAIVNGVSTGSPVTAGVLLFVGPNNTVQTQLCSGFMLGAFHMVTAAHCVCLASNNGADCQDEIDQRDVAELRVFLQHAGIFNVRTVTVSPSWIRDLRSDVAVVRLSQPVTTIRPAKLLTYVPSPGQNLTPVGFGNSAKGAQDHGIKRSGGAIVESCPPGILSGQNFCWRYDLPVGPRGADSNLCELDDGGPTYIDIGDGLVVAGLHSIITPGCGTGSLTVETSLSKNRAWLRQVLGVDFESVDWAGPGPFIGDNGADGSGSPNGFLVDTVTLKGRLGKSEDESIFSFVVPERGTKLIFSVNGNTGNGGDYDFFVRFGEPPTKQDNDCQVRGPGQFAACEFDNPEPGLWFTLVKHVNQNQGRGRSRFQVTATTILEPFEDGPAPSFPEKLRFKFRTSEHDFARLFWRDASDDEDGFELQRKVEGEDDFSSLVFTGRNDSDATDAIDTDLEYTYRVRAFNEFGFSLFSNSCIVNHPRPERPGRVRGVRVHKRKIKLGWKDNSDDEQGFQIQRRLHNSDDNFVTIAEVAANIDRFPDSPLSAGTTYDYRVRAIGHLDRCIKPSLYSRVKSITTDPRN